VLKEAYNQGALAACIKAGLVKESGAFMETMRALGQSTKGKLKESLKGVREAAKARQQAAWAAKGLRAGHPLKEQLAVANKELLSRAAPWLLTGGGVLGAGGLGYGAYRGAKALWPRALED
jgi:hypothetical protein